jgi:AcrR family transcriptional regulator
MTDLAARPTLTARRADELRLSIALAARDLFIADGDTSATVERICEVVGIAPRTFHRHFPVKEDVVMPLFRRFGEDVTLKVLEQATPDDDAIETLVRAFTTEIDRRHVLEFDRKFMTLILKNPQYRFRWLEWNEYLYEPITKFLATRFDLGHDPFLRTLPAQLIVQTGRYAYTRWVETGDFAALEASHRNGITMILMGLQAAHRTNSASRV